MIDENKLIEYLAQMYAKSLVKYGVDISEKLETATSISRALGEAYLRGRSDSDKRQWISVEEGMPENNKSVLCWAESLARGGDVCFVGSCHNGFWFLPTACDTMSYPNSSQYEVVAWQPLPEPYNPKKEGANNE